MQTVIVIVVMLVIAGAVSGVLLTRGGDVVSDLESQEVGPVTSQNCATLVVAGNTGVVASAAYGAAGSGDCVWAGQSVSAAQCTVVGGARVTAVVAAAGGVAANTGTNSYCWVDLTP